MKNRTLTNLASIGAVTASGVAIVGAIFESLLIVATAAVIGGAAALWRLKHREEVVIAGTKNEQTKHEVFSHLGA